MVCIQNMVAAQNVVYRHISPTPLHFYSQLSQRINANVYVKHENHQSGGSFKIRGGLNVMEHLKDLDLPGVITFSTGNHGMSIAESARIYGIPATVVVPKGSNVEKIRGIKAFGARLIEDGDTFEEAAAIGLALQEKENLRFIHAANEPHLINGVGTEFLEIISELPEIDAIILPIGGGSELAAAVTVFKHYNPAIQIYAVQAAASPAAYQSWKSGEITKAPNQTFAGGFATGEAFELPFSIYHNQIEDFVLLSEDELLEGIRLAFQYTHNLAEGAGASTIMAAIKLRDKLEGKNVVLQMSGGNETLDVIKKSLDKKGLEHIVQEKSI